MTSTKPSSNNPPSSPTQNLPLIHYDSSVTSQSDVDAAKRASTARQMSAVRKNVTFTTNSNSASGNASASPAILPHTVVETAASATKNQKNGHRPSTDAPAPINATNFKYLKHVLLKFMTSTEDEVGPTIIGWGLFQLASSAFSLRFLLGNSFDPCCLYLAQFLSR